MMTLLKFSLAALVVLAPALHLSSGNCSIAANTLSPSPSVEAQETTEEPSMLIQYLEIVSADADATCSLLEQVHGVSFGELDASLGNARTAALKGGGRISVRAPLAEHDTPIVRPYLLVEDIQAAVTAAEAAGGEFAMRTTEIPGHGKFAIYFLAGTQFGLWETPPSKASAADAAPPAPIEAQAAKKEKAVLVQYLEIVSADVDTTCSVLSKVHGVTFGEPDAGLGNARTATLKSGGMIGVRASMAEHDVPIVRPYVLVEDIKAATSAAEEAGGEFAMRATQLPGHGTFAIYFLAGTQFGLWEMPSTK